MAFPSLRPFGWVDLCANLSGSGDRLGCDQGMGGTGPDQEAMEEDEKNEEMTHGSLFSGIGGFDLAAEWAGWANLFHCEWNDFGQRILKHYWPNSESYGDITKTDFRKWRGAVDVLSGGFPCQPYSIAGKRLGKSASNTLPNFPINQ